MKNNFTKEKGFALATALILLGVVLIGSANIISIGRIEARISRSQKESIEAYYVAESGIQNAIWQLNHDNSLNQDFDDGDLNFTWNFDNKISNLRDVEVTIQSIAPGRAEIISTGLVNEDRYPAQRVVKVEIFKGPSSTESVLGNNSLFGNDGITVQNSSLTISETDILVNGDQDYVSSTVDADSRTLASVGDYTATNSTVTSGTISADNYPPAPDPITQPGIDFNYYANNANATYTTTQFRNLIKSGGTVDFTGPITYITGGVMNLSPADLNGNIDSVNIVIHGLLVSNSNLTIITSQIVRGTLKTINLTVLDDAGGPSGLISRTHTSLSGNGTIDIQGTVYAGNTFTLSNTDGATFDGGIIAKSLNFSSANNVILIGDPDRVTEIIGIVPSPSVIQIDHWEEEY